MPAKLFKFNCLPILCWPKQSLAQFWLLGWLFVTSAREEWDEQSSNQLQHNMVCVAVNTSKRLTAKMGKGQWLVLSGDIGHNFRKKKWYGFFFCFETNIYWRLTVPNTRYTLSPMIKRRNSLFQRVRGKPEWNVGTSVCTFFFKMSPAFWRERRMTNLKSYCKSFSCNSRQRLVTQQPWKVTVLSGERG